MVTVTTSPVLMVPLSVTDPMAKISRLAALRTASIGIVMSPGVNTITRRSVGSATYRLRPSQAMDVGVGIASTAANDKFGEKKLLALVTWSVNSSTCPRITSAGNELAVGMVL